MFIPQNAHLEEYPMEPAHVITFLIIWMTNILQWIIAIIHMLYTIIMWKPTIKTSLNTPWKKKMELLIILLMDRKRKTATLLITDFMEQKSTEIVFVKWKIRRIVMNKYRRISIMIDTKSKKIFITNVGLKFCKFGKLRKNIIKDSRVVFLWNTALRKPIKISLNMKDLKRITAKITNIKRNKRNTRN